MTDIQNGIGYIPEEFVETMGTVSEGCRALGLTVHWDRPDEIHPEWPVTILWRTLTGYPEVWSWPHERRLTRYGVIKPSTASLPR